MSARPRSSAGSAFVCLPVVLGLLIGCAKGGGGDEQAQDDALVGPRPDGAPRAIANIGDSMSQAFDADDSLPIDATLMSKDPSAVFHDQPELSWVQGTDPRIGSVLTHYESIVPGLSHAAFSHTGAELVGRGSTIPNFEQQARALVASGARPDLVYVLLGGNDVCNRERNIFAPTANMYSVDEWRAAARKGLDVLAESLPSGATVRVFSMPRVDILYDTVGDRKVPIELETELGNVQGEMTCKVLWATAFAAGHGICPLVTLEPLASARHAIGERIDAYNDGLALEVRSMNGDAARNPKGVVFESDWHGSLAAGQRRDSSGGTMMFSAETISRRDCFHPSIAGQQLIASLALTKSVWTR